MHTFIFYLHRMELVFMFLIQYSGEKHWDHRLDTTQLINFFINEVPFLKSYNYYNYIYIFGGYNSNLGYLTSLEVYSVVSKFWKELAPMNCARFTPAGAIDASGIIYALGGDGLCPCDGSVETYNPSTNVWINGTIPPMIYARAAFGAARGSDNRIYAVAGECDYPMLATAEALTISS